MEFHGGAALNGNSLQAAGLCGDERKASGVEIVFPAVPAQSLFCLFCNVNAPACGGTQGHADGGGPKRTSDEGRVIRNVKFGGGGHDEVLPRFLYGN